VETDPEQRFPTPAALCPAAREVQPLTLTPVEPQGLLHLPKQLETTLAKGFLFQNTQGTYNLSHF